MRRNNQQMLKIIGMSSVLGYVCRINYFLFSEIK